MLDRVDRDWLDKSGHGRQAGKGKYKCLSQPGIPIEPMYLDPPYLTIFNIYIMTKLLSMYRQIQGFILDNIVIFYCIIMVFLISMKSNDVHFGIDINRNCVRCWIILELRWRADATLSWSATLKVTQVVFMWRDKNRTISVFDNSQVKSNFAYR